MKELTKEEKIEVLDHIEKELNDPQGRLFLFICTVYTDWFKEKRNIKKPIRNNYCLVYFPDLFNLLQTRITKQKWFNKFKVNHEEKSLSCSALSCADTIGDTERERFRKVRLDLINECRTLIK